MGGNGNDVTQQQSFIGGGASNTVAAAASAIVGGSGNRVEAGDAFIGAGNTNYNAGQFGALCAGYNNVVGGSCSFVGAGKECTASAAYTVVGGGYRNKATGLYSSILGGTYHTASGQRAAIIGGTGSTVSANGSIAIGSGLSVSTANTITLGGGTSDGGNHAYSIVVSGTLSASSNVTASGHVSASTYYGDGSNLTGIAAGGGGGIFAQTAGNTAFTTSSVGIGQGIDTPAALLYISSSNDAASGSLFQVDSKQLGTVLYVTASGRVGIGSATPDAALTVSGSISASVNVSASALWTEIYLSSSEGHLRLDSGDGNINLAHGGSTKTIINQTTYAPDVVFDVTAGHIGFAPMAGGGAVNITGSLSASSNVSASQFWGDGSNITGLTSAAISSYTNASNNRIITSVDASTVNSEANLTFNGSTLAVTGSVLPGADNTHDLGSSGMRWANVYTGDLHLANDRGDWTVVEEENYLTIKNNKTGKRFKLLMEEIE